MERHAVLFGSDNPMFVALLAAERLQFAWQGPEPIVSEWCARPYDDKHIYHKRSGGETFPTSDSIGDSDGITQ